MIWVCQVQMIQGFEILVSVTLSRLSCCLLALAWGFKGYYDHYGIRGRKRSYSCDATWWSCGRHSRYSRNGYYSGVVVMAFGHFDYCDDCDVCDGCGGCDHCAGMVVVEGVEGVGEVLWNML